MDKDVGMFSAFLDEVEGGVEGVAGVLGVAVVEVEDEVFEMFGVFEVEVDPWANGIDIVFLEFLEVVGKVIAADPAFMEISFFIENLLSTVIISTTESEHLKIINVAKSASF